MLTQQLVAGIQTPNRRGEPVLYRFLTPTDDLVAITGLLHRAYAPLAAAGMRYVASHQPVEMTRQRMAKGDTIVAVSSEEVVGVVTLARASETQGTPFYDRDDVAMFGQYAVNPDMQHTGVGSTLLALVEKLAAERGVRELALDTSEHAAALIEMYAAHGYRFVEHFRFSTVNYRSVVMAKTLPAAGGS